MNKITTDNHPAALRAIAKAAELGSTATTPLGAMRYLLKNRSRYMARRMAERRPIESKHPFLNTWAAGRYKNAESERKLYGDAKRARKDKAFRAGWLRRLRTQWLDVHAPPTERTCDAVTAWMNGAKEREALIESIRRRAEIAGYTLASLPPPAPPPWAATLMISYGMVTELRKAGEKIILRGRDAEIVSTLRTSYGEHAAPVTEWSARKGWRTVKRAVHSNYVRSFAVLREDGTAEWVVGKQRGVLTPPAGLRLDIDGNGLRVVREDGEDFHFTALCVTQLHSGKRTWDSIAQETEFLHRQRQETAARMRAEAAESEGVFICAADSRRAGNCLGGTMSFASKHGLDPKKHYTAIELLSVGGSDLGRVRLAISAAIHRHRREMERGFSLLEEHQLKTNG